MNTNTALLSRSVNLNIIILELNIAKTLHDRLLV
jgi:hypothetical protein